MLRHFVAVGCLTLSACSSLSSDPGYAAALQVAGAQYKPGAMPGDGAGPKVLALDVSLFTVAPGASQQPLVGTLDQTATAVAFQLAGDRGWWLFPAGVPDVNSPTLPTFMTQMGFAPTLEPGPVMLMARAVDANGNFGPASSLMLTVASPPASSARLVVTLSWAGASDLDLHVVEPDGTELWSDSPASPSGGMLDFDSNPQCVIDGHDREQASWAMPPGGHYLVRVDTFSLCGQPSSFWQVTATLDGNSLGASSGVSLDADTIGPHQRGSGRTALEFDVPSS